MCQLRIWPCFNIFRCASAHISKIRDYKRKYLHFPHPHSAWPSRMSIPLNFSAKFLNTSLNTILVFRSSVPEMSWHLFPFFFFSWAYWHYGAIGPDDHQSCTHIIFCISFSRNIDTLVRLGMMITGLVMRERPAVIPNTLHHTYLIIIIIIIMVAIIVIFAIIIILKIIIIVNKINMISVTIIIITLNHNCPKLWKPQFWVHFCEQLVRQIFWLDLLFCCCWLDNFFG